MALIVEAETSDYSPIVTIIPFDFLLNVLKIDNKDIKSLIVVYEWFSLRNKLFSNVIAGRVNSNNKHSAMVNNFKSKDFKHAQGNERRKESLLRKFEEKLNQNELIKNALSSSSVGNRKKIVFDDDDDFGEIDSKEDEQIKTGRNSITKETSKVKLHLFDKSDDDGDDNNDGKYDISIKNQFEGKKGYKLMNLQSNYNNDERFKLDERFYDDDSENDNEKSNSGDAFEGDDRENIVNSESNHIGEEKIKQLKVLENVLGYPVQPERKVEKKSKRSFCEMVRFDEYNDDHKRPDDQSFDKGTEEPRAKKKKKLSREERKEKKKEERKERKKEEKKEDVEKDAISVEKFYKVSDDLKVALKKSKNENTSFSLLAALSRKAESDDEDHETENEINFEDQDYEINDEKVDFSPKDVDEPKEEKILKVEGIKKEKIFFIQDDDRIQEGLNFINMKNSEEAKLALDNYEHARKDIREILRLRWQKHRQRMNPFKKKIGVSGKRNSTFDKRKNNMFSGKSKIRRRK